MKSLRTLKWGFPLVLILLLSSCNKDDVPGGLGGDNPVLGNTRYRDFVFTDILTESGVTYGENTDQAGRNIQLKMNIYQPANDTAMARPLVILAHGGGFAEGSREDFDGLAKSFAQAGFVSATISYRLMTGDAILKVAAIDATHDLLAAVRFFTKDNTYQIDTGNVFVGGFSAGAVAALHAAYFDETELATAPAEIRDYIPTVGGMSGNSGNPGAPESIKGVINISGGLFRADWASAGEPMLISIHGTRDIDVYFTKDPEATTNPEGDFTEGSGLIHPILDELGIVNLLKAIEGGDHGAFDRCEECVSEIRAFLYTNL